jgi:diguanylate cyclase (GGDEF)-like protein
MSIRYKLLMAFGAVLILVGGLAFYGIRQISDAGALVLRLYDGPLISVNYTRAAHAKFNHARAVMEKALSLSDDTPETVKALEVSVADLLEDLRIARERTPDPPIIRAVDRARELIVDWHKTGLRILHPLDEGITELPLQTSVSSKADAVAAVIDDVVELAAAYGFEFRSAAEAQVKAAASNMIVLALGATLLAVVFSLIFSYSVSRPIHEAMAVAARVAAGDFSDTIKTVRRDEMGGLLRSLGEMQTGLRGKAALEQALTEAKDRAHTEVVTLKEGELQLQNVRFEAALSNMAQGLVMFDGNRRLLVVNQPFASLFAVPREKFQVGMTPEEFVEMIVRERNLPPERAASLHAQQKYMIDKGKQHNYAFDTSDGRRMSVVHTPMSNGGWVTTYLDMTARYRAEAKVAHMAHHDALTELPNRLRFREQLQHELGRLRDGSSIAVLCLDLDLFKGVNDTLGHPAGDQLLRIVARRLSDAVRDSDMVARLGGDEFAIIQTRTLQQPDEATALAGRLIDVISAPYDIEDHQMVVGLSVGIAIAPLDGRDADQLIKNADMALYRAKEEGRGTYRFFEQAMDARARTRRELELDLRSALHAGEFVLNYQPIVDVRTGDVTTFEALVRWHHPRRGLISPADFIPLAEATGLIVPLGEWVLRKACSDAASWSRPVRVAVNLSPAQFKHRTLVQSVVSAVATSGLAPDRLELEITESVLLQDSEATLAILHTLRDFGVRISMDDFGTGYSSLSYLRSFPFDKIKIDQSFVRDLATRDDCVAIVRAVTGLGNSLGIATTAEGVETTEQLELLRQHGCGEVQGFLFSRPRPAADVEAMLRQTETARSAA